jgi:hypothetical protein
VFGGGELMTPEKVYRCFEAVLGLPLSKQAVCVRLAAEVTAPIWRKCREGSGVQDYSIELLHTFDQWLSGAATDDDLDRVAKWFLEMLPQDLREADDLASGYAGWALFDIAFIALEQAGEVHHSVFITAVCYAAAAHCRTNVGPTEVSWVRLTAAELEFLDSWWRHCCERFTELADATRSA